MDTNSGDVTMFAVARYAADEDEWYKNNFVISTRSKNSWGWVLDIKPLVTHTWEGQSAPEQETQIITLTNGSISNGEVFSIIHGGATATYSAISDGISEGLDGIVSAINLEFPDTLYCYKSGSTIVLNTRVPETSKSVSVSSNLSVSKDPPTGVFTETANDAFHLIAIDVKGSTDQANVWLDLLKYHPIPSGFKYLQREPFT